MQSFKKVKKLTAEQLAQLTPTQLQQRIKERSRQKEFLDLNLKGPLFALFKD